MSSGGMFAKFGFANFKSIKKAGLMVDKITFLTGPNSSGKSNLLEGIRILSEYAKATNPIPLTELMTSPYLRQQEELFNYPSFESLFYKNDTKSTISFSINVKTNEEIKEKLKILLKKENIPILFKSSRVRSRKMRYNYIGYSFSFNPSKKEGHETIYIENRILAQILLKNNEFKFKRPDILSIIVPARSSFEITPFSRFQHTGRLNGFSEDEIEIIKLCIETSNDIIIFIRNKLRRVYFLSTFRGLVKPTVEASGYPDWVGKDGEDLIKILSQCFASRRYEKKAQKILYWAHVFGISGLKSGYFYSGRLSSDYEDPILKTELALSLASHGSRQILTILTQLFWSEPGDLILIEEPEISLHPEAQILLPDLFADAVKDNKQIICSTHSPFLILALPRVVQKSKISGSDIGVYQIEKTEDGTISKRKEIDKRGYVKGWIDRFAKVDDELLSEYLEGLNEEGI